MSEATYKPAGYCPRCGYALDPGKCPEADPSSIYLNRGICLARQGRFEEAETILDRATDPDLRFRVEAQRLEIIRKLGRYDEAISRGEAVLEEADAAEVEPQVLSAIMTELGHAYWLGRKGVEHAIAMAMEALRQSPSFPAALRLIREVDGTRSPTAKYYRMMIQGDWPEPDEEGRELGFFATFDIVADSPDEALEYARRLEAKEVGASLRIEECKDLEPRPDEPKGIYRYTPHYLFPMGEQSEDA
jgi:tetratricopeptide (TPR) repeat protein